MLLLLLLGCASAGGSDRVAAHINASCAAYGSCSYVKGRACQCNLGECSKYNDCCADVQAVCAAATCSAYGCHNKSALCSCTDSCSHKHECCVDFHQTCPRHPHPGPPPGPPPPPTGPCGFEDRCPPQQFHLAPTELPTAVVVSFVTGAKWTDTPNCSLGIAPGQQSTSFLGATTTYTDGGWLGKLHAVRLTGLAADGKQVYYYSCGGPEFSFVSPPPPGPPSFPMTVAAVADLGSRCSREGGGCGNATFDSLARSAQRGDFGLLLHAGDIAYTSGKQHIWDEYGRDIEGTAARVPYAVAPGNHEHYYNFSAYRHRFDMPRKNISENLWWCEETPFLGAIFPNSKTIVHQDRLDTHKQKNGEKQCLCRSWSHGGIHVLSFSTEHNYSKGSEQWAWIEEDLKSVDRTITPWLLVQGHRPIYCSTADEYDCGATYRLKTRRRSC
jgi:hypothetical protein